MKDIDRRTFLESAVGMAIVARFPFAQGNDRVPAELTSIIRGKEVLDEGIVLTTPSTAENGNSVPVSVEVNTEFVKTAHVRALHLFATKNPRSKIATFRYTQANAVVKNATRIRLAETQQVVAVAELQDGRLLKASKLVKVTLGGCGT